MRGKVGTGCMKKDKKLEERKCNAHTITDKMGTCVSFIFQRCKLTREKGYYDFRIVRTFLSIFTHTCV